MAIEMISKLRQVIDHTGLRCIRLQAAVAQLFEVCVEERHVGLALVLQEAGVGEKVAEQRDIGTSNRDIGKGCDRHLQG